MCRLARTAYTVILLEAEIDFRLTKDLGIVLRRLFIAFLLANLSATLLHEDYYNFIHSGK